MLARRLAANPSTDLTVNKPESHLRFQLHEPDLQKSETSRLVHKSGSMSNTVMKLLKNVIPNDRNATSKNGKDYTLHDFVSPIHKARLQNAGNVFIIMATPDLTDLKHHPTELKPFSPSPVDPQAYFTRKLQESG
jgi:hypothetical protein